MLIKLKVARPLGREVLFIETLSDLKVALPAYFNVNAVVKLPIIIFIIGDAPI
jgi:hypothetical protein